MMLRKPANRSADQQSNSRTGRGGQDRRLRLLGSASVMASAIVFAGMMSSPAAAQSLPPTPLSEILPPVYSSGSANVPVMRERGNDSSPISSTSGPSFQAPIASHTFVERQGVTLNPPTVPVTGNNVTTPTPTPTAPATAAQAPASGPVTTFSSSVIPSPGDTDTNGINVLASANYFGSQIDFNPSAAVDIIEVFTSESIINWTTFTAGAVGTDVTFLGAGGNLEFTSALADYTVLNRVFTPGIDSAIRIDGSVTSSVLSGAATGGNIWFYSPGGMIIGSTGSFNVGSLVLSSSNLNSIDAGGSELNFLGVAEPDTAVVVEAGATIDASNYVAMIAPRVVQGGTVTVDGSVAYVGAEEAQLTINNGLFDITVGVGTADANGVVHTGTTTGAASQAVVDGDDDIINADARAIYMVSVAKNDAITMLVGGDIGYQPAAAAARTSNGSIILSAGANVAAGGTLRAPTITVDEAGAVAGGYIEFQGGNLNSNVTAVASDTIDITPSFGEILTVGSDAREAYDMSLNVGNDLVLGAGIGGVFSVGGDLNLRSGLNQAVGGDVTIQVAGNVPGPFDPVFANGQMIIGGNLNIDASGRGRDDFFTFRNNGGTGIGEAATGGDISFSVTNNAVIDIGGSLVLDASAQGGKGENVNGASTAGSIQFTVNGGTLDVAGGVTLNAAAIAAQTNKVGGNGVGLLGADSVAGDITLNLNGGTTNVGSLIMDVSADGSSGGDTNVVQDNQGIAGDARIDATGGSHNFASIDIRALSSSGSGSDGAGNSTRGTVNRSDIDVSVTGAGTSVLTTDDLRITARTSGLVAAPTDPTVTIVAQGTGTGGGLLIGDDIVIDTQYQAGSQTETNVASGVSILVDDATVSFDRLSATATGGSLSGFGSGQNYQGGEIGLTATNQGTFFGNDVTLTASAVGAAGVGGLGTGGAITITADDGTILVGNRFTASAAGRGGAGEGGIGQGGAVTVNLRGADGSMDIGTLRLNTDGSIASDEEVFFGGNDGDGGSGLAGDVAFNFEGGAFTGGAIEVSADGFGGQGGFLSGPDAAVRGGTGGAAAGGDVVVNLDGSTVSVNSFAVTAAGVGGGGAFGDIDFDERSGDGGDATGGTATFNAAAGSLDVTTNLTVSANATAGRAGSGSGYAGGNGGSAVSGDATFNMDGTATVTAGTVVISSDASGGDGGRSFSYTDPISGDFVSGEAGGNAGSGTAGNAVFNNTSGDISFTTLTVSADGEGGEGGESRGTGTGEAINDGGLGGAGIGGNATINLNQDDASNPTYIVGSTGLGGEGGDGFNGGAGGSATGGTARLNINDAAVSLTRATIDASATGAQGGSSTGVNGNGGAGGSGNAGSAILDVNGANAVLTSTNALTMLANGVGGDGVAGADVFAIFGPTGPDRPNPGDAGSGGVGGSAQGGMIQVIVRDGATATYLSDSSTSAGASGGDGGNAGESDFGAGFNGDGGGAGAANGGTIDISATNGGSLTLSAVSTDIGLGTDAIGGIGGDGGAESEGQINTYGDNSQTTGGTITVSADGAGSSVNLTADLVASSSAFGARDGRSDAVGASGQGGVLTLSTTNGGALNTTRAIRLSGTARAADGRFLAGTGTGGTVNVIADSGSSMNLTSLDINVASEGGLGGFGESAGGRDGGDAVGGNVNVVIDETASADLTSMTINADGFGANGGGANFNQASGDAGDGTGGNISVVLVGTITSLSNVSLQSNGRGGTGGTGTLGSASGASGNGQGGSIDLTIQSTGAALPDLTGLSLTAFGEGGLGADGANSLQAFGFAATDGASGGTGSGGDVTLRLAGASASLTVDSGASGLSAGAQGGLGGSGGDDLDGGTAGSGGAGGDATGGTVAIIAESGTIITLDSFSGPFMLSSNGTGGTGGSGGNIDMISGGTAGDGGDGGTGTGGSPILRAIGGTIQGFDVNLEAVGFGANGGLGGDDGTVTIGAQGNGGGGVGGSPSIEALEGSPGIITLGAVTIDAGGVAGGGTVTGSTGGGQITITDASSDPAGLITMSSLIVTAAGAPAAGTPSLIFESDSGPITVTGNVDADVSGDIVFDFDGTGQLVVGGNAVLNADGNIAATHTNNGAGLASVDIAGNFTATAGGDFNTATGSIVDSEGALTVDANNIIFDRLTTTGGDLTLTAGNDITGVNAINAAVVGNPGNDRVVMTAGNDITVTGTVQSVDDGVFLDADGDIDVNAVSAADNLDVIALGSVTLGTAVTTNAATLFTTNIRGTSVSAGSIDAAGFLNLTATGGSIDVTGAIVAGSNTVIAATEDFRFGSFDGEGLTSIQIDGDVVGGNLDSRAALDVDADNITLGDMNVGGTRLSLDATGNISLGNAVSVGNVADIQIRADGDIDFLSLDSDRLLNVAGAAVSGGDVTADAQIDLTGTSVDVGDLLSTGGFVNVDSTVGSITTGTVTSDSFSVAIDSAADVTTGDLNAAGGITVDAMGDGDIADANANASLRFTIGGNLTAGLLDSRATSPGMTLNVTGDADIEGASANGLLTVNVDGTLTGGDFIGNSLTRLRVGSVDVDLVQSLAQSAIVQVAGGDAVLGAIAASSSAEITGADNIVVGNATSGGSTTLRGDNVTLNSGDITGSLELRASNGDVSGTGTVTVGGNIRLIATGDIGFGSLTAQGAAFTADAGGALAFTSATSNGTIGFSADTISFDAITSTGAATLTATGGAANSINGGSIDTGGTGDVTLTSDGLIDVDDVTARIFTANAGTDLTLGAVDAIGRDIRGIAINLDAGGTISFTSLTSGRGIDIDAPVIDAGDITSDNGVNILADSITVGDVLVTELGDVTLNATDGALMTGDLTSHTFGLDIRSSGTMNVGDLAVTGNSNSSDITVVAGGDTTLGDVNAGDRLTIDVTGNLTTGNLVSDNVSPGMRIDVTGDANIASTFDPNGPLLLTVGGALTGGDFTTNGVLNLEADSIDIDSATANGGIGFVNITTTTGNASIDVISAGNDINSDVAGNLQFVTATAADNIDLVAVGSVLGGDLTAADDLDINAGNIVIGNASATNIALSSATDILFDSLVSPNAINLSALAGTIGANTAGTGDIDSDNDINLTAALIAVGDVTTGGSLTASATVGDASFGAVDAVDTVTITASGTPTVASISSGGNANLTGASVTLSGGDIGGALTLTATAGDVTLALDGTDQILVAGQAALNATGDIIVTHTNNAADTISLDATGNILAAAQGSIDAQAGSILSGNEVFLLASRDVDAADVRGVPGIVIGAGGNVTLADATVTGPQGISNIRGLVVDAGLDPLGFGSGFYDNAANATITGTVSSYADVTIRAGGNAVFAAGSTTSADDSVIVQTGDDIIVQAGATLISANNPSIAPNPADTFNGIASLQLDAGGLVNLLSIPLTPRASLVVDGTLNSNDGAIIAIANAIDGLDGTFSGSSIALDIRDAPPVGFFQGDDAGLLSANCVVGNICVGDIIANNVIEIGQNSNNDVIQLFIEQGTVNANEIRITTREDIVMGTAGIATTLNAANIFSATSTTGDVNLLDAAISSDQITISAAGSLIGSASLTSTNDIGITVGDSITLNSLNAGGQLTQVATIGGALEGFYSVPGSIDIGTLTVGAGSVTYDAGGDLELGTVTVPGTNITLSAGGLASLGSTNTATNVNIDGNSVVIGTVDVTGDISVDSNSTVNLVDLAAAGNIFVFAATDITGGDLTAGGSVSLDGGNIAIGDASGNIIDLTSGTDILFNSLVSPSAITLTAANGTIGANTGNGDIDSDDDVTLTAQVINVGDVTSGGSISGNASAGDATFGTVDAVTDITISATGTPTVANAISGGNTSITGASVSLTNGTVGGDLTLNATAGDIDGNGTVSVGGAIDFDATGDIGFGALDAQGGNFSVDAGGDVDFTEATSSADVLITAVGTITGGDVTAAGTAQLDGGGIAVDTVDAGTIALISDADILFNSLTSPNAISLTAAGGMIGTNGGAGEVNSDGDINITAESIDLGDLTSGGTITAAATAGNAGLGTVDAADDIAITAVGTSTTVRAVSGGTTSITGESVFLGSGAIGDDLILTATDGDIDATRAGLLVASLDPMLGGGRALFSYSGTVGGGFVVFPAGDNITVGGVIALDASNNVTFESLNAQGGDFTVLAGNDVSFEAATSAANVLITAGGNLLGRGGLLGPVLAPRFGSIDAANDVILSAGDIEFATINAGGAVSATSTNGNINLSRIDAVGLIDLDSTGSIFVDHAETDGDFNANAIGNVTTGLNSIITGGDIIISGDIVNLGNSSAGGLVDVEGSQIDFVTLVAGSTVDLDTVSITSGTGNGNITGVDLTAGPGASSIVALNAISLTGATAIGGSLSMDAGTNILLNTVSTQTGGVSADANGTITYTSIDSGADISMFAGGLISGGDLDAVTGLQLDGGDIAIGDAAANTIDITTGADILFDSLTAPSAITLTAAMGTIAANTGNGDIDSGAAVDLTAQTIAIGNVTSGGTFDADATAGAATLGTVTSAGSTRVTAAGTLTTGDVSTTGLGASIGLYASGATSDVIAGALTTDSGDILISSGRDIDLSTAATSIGTPTAGSIGLLAAGDVTATGLLSAGEDVGIRALGAVTLADVIAGDDVSVDADGAINLTSATSTGTGVDLFSLAFAEANAGQVGSIAFAAEVPALVGSNVQLIGGTDVTATGAIDAADDIIVSAVGTPTLANAISGGNTSITGTSVTLNNGTIGGDLTLNAVAGDIDGTGTVTVGGAIDFDATGNVGFGTLNAQGGTFTVDAGGAITFVSATSADFITMNAVGAINGGDLDAVNALTLNGATIAIGDASAGAIDLTSAADILFDSLTSANAISLSAINGTIGANTGPGDIDSGSDVDLLAQSIAVGDVTAGGTLDLESLVGGITAADLTSVGNMIVRTADGASIDNATTTAGFIRILGDGNVSLGDVTSADFVGIIVDGDVSFDDIASIGTGGVTVTGSFTGNSFDAGSALDITASTVDVATIISGDEFFGTATMGSFNAGSVSAVEIDISSVTDTIVGALDAGDTLEIDADSIQIGTADAGTLIDLSANDSVTATGAITSGGQVNISATNGAFTGTDVDADDDITITAAGTANFSSVTSGGDTSITAASVAFGNGDIGGNLSLTSTIGDVTGTGTTTAGGDIDVLSAGAISFADIATPGGRFFATADGDVTVGAVSTATGIFISSDNGGDIVATSLTSDQDIGVDTAGTFTAQSVLGSATGSLVTIDADNGIDIGTVTGQTAGLNSDAGAVTVNTDIDVAGVLTASGTSVSLRSLGDLRTTTDASNGNIGINVDGDLVLEGASAQGNIAVISGGSTTVNGAAGVVATQPPASNDGAISFNVGTDLIVNSAINAASELSLNSGGIIDLQGVASGAVITTNSADINIGTSGALGRSDQTSEINISTDADILLGGAGGATAGFELDNDEFSRVHSGGDVTISANGFSTGDGNLTVADLSVTVGAGTGAPTDGNIGQDGGLFLEANNDVAVTGNATVSGAGADNILSIDALSTISIDTDTGNLRVEDTNGNAIGAIDMTAQTIFAASAAAVNDLSNGNPTTADFDTRLGVNDGATRDEGYIQSSSVTFNIDDDLLIQNSGAGTDFADRRGVSADSVVINAASTDAVIIFNGIVGGNAGLDAIQIVDVPSAFDQASTINGCLIINPASCAPVVTPNPDPTTGNPNDDLIQELIDEQEEGSSQVDSPDKVGTMLVDFREDPENSLDPLIDEPVTGAGNEDLWVSDEEECDGTDETCDAEFELEPAE